MKKLMLSIVLVLLLSVPAFATSWGDTYNDYYYTTTNQGGQGGAGGNASVTNSNHNTNLNSNINKNENRNTNLNTNINSNTNRNTNVQGQNQRQSQGQAQGQGQGQNQFGYVSIESPQALLSPPSQSVPELNFGSGKLDWNFAKSLPKVAIPLYNPNETVVKVVDTTANVKAKNLLPKLLDMIADQQPLSVSDRLIIIKAEAQKTWTTGGNLGGAGSGLASNGLGGGSGAGSLVPSWGGTKADDLYTIIIVRVAL